MNRELLVTLLRKDIQELDMITQGFMEMSLYPKAILLLAQRKTEDIQRYIVQLSELGSDANVENLKQDESETQQPSVVVSNVDKSVVQEEQVDELIIDIDENNEESTNEELPIEIIEFENNTMVSSVTQLLEIEEIKLAPPVVEHTEKEEKPIHFSTTRNELLSKTDNTLSATLANKKIDDLKQAISIGDRFRFQRELFRGNGEEMNKSLNYINQLATLDEALSFLTSKYGWSDDNEAVEDFLQIVRRRFL